MRSWFWEIAALPSCPCLPQKLSGSRQCVVPGMQENVPLGMMSRFHWFLLLSSRHVSIFLCFFPTEGFFFLCLWGSHKFQLALQMITLLMSFCFPSRLYVARWQLLLSKCPALVQCWEAWGIFRSRKGTDIVMLAHSMANVGCSFLMQSGIGKR